MEFFDWIGVLSSDCGPLCQPWQDTLQSLWDIVPGDDTAAKLGVLFAIFGGLPTAYWLYQKWSKTDTESKVDELGSKVERQFEQLRKDLIEQARAQSAALPGSDQPAAKQAEAIIEQDIGEAISTLAKAGKIEAAEAAGRGDTKAADEALAAKIAKIDRARTLATKEEATLYRQRGALAYLHDTDAALRFYARAAELDPGDGEALFFLGQLQARAGYRPAAKQSFERLIALGNQDAEEASQHWPYLLLGDVEAALGNRDAVLARRCFQQKGRVSKRSRRPPQVQPRIYAWPSRPASWIAGFHLSGRDGVCNG